VRKLFLIVLVAVLLAASITYADNIDLNGQMRWRTELNGKDFNSDTGLAWESYLRTRINLKFDLEDNVEVFAQMQDSRVFGSPSSGALSSDRDVNLGLHQAYIKAWDLLKPGLGILGGRYAMKYGNERLFGPVGWSNVGRSFDGFKIFYENDNGKVDLFCNTLYENGQPSNYGDRFFWGLYGSSKQYPIDLFFIWNTDKTPVANDSSKKELSRVSFGAYSSKWIDNFYYEATFGYQTGSVHDTVDIAAWMVQAEARYKVNPDMNLCLAAGADITSGDDPDTNDKNEAWNELYPTAHKFRGFMDFFTGTQQAGLMDIYLRGKIAPSENTLARLDFHIFNTMQDYASAVDGKNTKSVGNELDLTLTCNAVSSSKINFGYSVFMPSEDWLGTGADNANWFYLQWLTNF